MLESGTSSLDPNYELTLDEWMKIKNYTSWKFYADHHYLSVFFERKNDQMDPKQSGTYLVRYELETEDKLHMYDYGQRI